MHKARHPKGTGRIDKPFLLTLLVLIGIGLLMVFSASVYSSTLSGESGYDQFRKQLLFAALGLALMFMLSKFNYKYFRSERIAAAFLGAAFVLLLMVWMPGVGVNVNNANRWVKIGFTFQPSEIAKMAGIIYVSAFVYNHPKCLNAPLGLNERTKELWLKCYLPTLLVCGVTVLEPSMSAAMAIGLGMVSVLWFSGISMRQFLPFCGLILVGGIGALMVSWRLTRLLALFGRNNANYQITQSLLAFGSGGIFGVGLGNGKQKLLFLPEIQNDFIFANIGEEFGLVGCLIVLGLYAFLIYRGFQIGIACKDRFGFSYTLSTMTLLAFQVFVNVAVATRIYPVTGMALPFISYGGTSIVILLITMGPILNISRQVDLAPVGSKGERGGGRAPSKGSA